MMNYFYILPNPSLQGRATLHSRQQRMRMAGSFVPSQRLYCFWIFVSMTVGKKFLTLALIWVSLIGEVVFHAVEANSVLFLQTLFIHVQEATHSKVIIFPSVSWVGTL